MTSCPLYNSSNLAYTGNKFNNPYVLIQKAGKKSKKQKTKNQRKTRNQRNKKPKK